jgi:hypothetical protein
MDRSNCRWRGRDELFLNCCLVSYLTLWFRAVLVRALKSLHLGTDSSVLNSVEPPSYLRKFLVVWFH